MPTQEIRERLAESGKKIKSFKYWCVGLVDAVVNSIGTSLFGTPVLDVAGIADMSWSVFGFLMLIGAINGFFRFWMRNPLADILADY